MSPEEAKKYDAQQVLNEINKKHAKTPVFKLKRKRNQNEEPGSIIKKPKLTTIVIGDESPGTSASKIPRATHRQRKPTSTQPTAAPMPTIDLSLSQEEKSPSQTPASNNEPQNVTLSPSQPEPTPEPLAVQPTQQMPIDVSFYSKKQKM